MPWCQKQQKSQGSWEGGQPRRGSAVNEVTGYDRFEARLRAPQRKPGTRKRKYVTTYSLRNLAINGERKSRDSLRHRTLPEIPTLASVRAVRQSKRQGSINIYNIQTSWGPQTTMWAEAIQERFHLYHIGTGGKSTHLLLLGGLVSGLKRS